MWSVADTIWSGWVIMICFSVSTSCITLSQQGKEHQNQKGVSAFSFASYYQDHMVLQRAPLQAGLWGYADLDDIGKNMSVTVISSGTSEKTVSSVVQRGPFSMKAIWRVILSPVAATTPHLIVAKLDGYKSIVLQDVLFGDVWLCSGQSNMQFGIMQMFGHQGELSDAKNYGNIRLLNIERVTSATPLYDVKKIISPWMPPAGLSESDGVLGGFSAVCYMFGKSLHQKLGYPIGLIDSTWGGTPIESWSDPMALARCGLDRRHDVFKDMMNYVSPPPHNNSVLWNAMIHPMVNMTIKGVIWYQGEANTNYHTEYYGCSFPRMIDSWRYNFRLGTNGQTPPDMPFGFVQIGPIDNRNESQIEFGYPTIRWHQMMDDSYGMPLKNTFMGVAMDLTDPLSPYGQVHIRDKITVAKRLSNAALNIIYKQGAVIDNFPFPTLESVDIKHKEMMVQFSYNMGQINVRSNDGFEICCGASYKLCPLNSATNWVPSPIVRSNATSIWLSWKLCNTNQIAAYRYSWRATACDYHRCAIYSDISGDPLPTFTKILKKV